VEEGEGGRTICDEACPSCLGVFGVFFVLCSAVQRSGKGEALPTVGDRLLML
jgi:hypothetical protein